MSRSLTASDRTALIRLAYEMPRGNQERRAILAGLKRVAMEHASEDAMKEYLKKHPGADPKNHTVKKNESGEGDGGGKMSDAVKKKLMGWASKVKGLTDKGKKTLEELPENAAKFVADPEYRKETLTGAAKAMKEAPKKYAKEVVHHFKHEVEEIGGGLKRMSKGQLPTKSQAKAMAGMAVEISVAALSIKTAGAFGAGVSLGKSLGKHLALSAINPLLGDAYVFGLEGSHLIHGIEKVLHIAAEKGSTDPEQFIEDLVLAIADQMEKGIDDDVLVKALNGEKA